MASRPRFLRVIYLVTTSSNARSDIGIVRNSSRRLSHAPFRSTSANENHREPGDEYMMEKFNSARFAAVALGATLIVSGAFAQTQRPTREAEDRSPSSD